MRALGHGLEAADGGGMLLLGIGAAVAVVAVAVGLLLWRRRSHGRA